MTDCREEWYDSGAKVAITLVDVTAAAQALARGHLSGPVSTYYLSRALAAAALLGAETSEKDETVIVQMKCDGPIGGLNVECTAAGTLRGYTEKKLLDDFDGEPAAHGLSAAKRKDFERRILGRTQFQVTRSVPGRILSQGISNSLDGYLAGSLQRKAVICTEAAVSDEVEILEARGAMVEALPDSALGTLGAVEGPLTGSSRKILERLGFPKAELRRTTPLAFACRCSPDRAAAMLAALSPEERASLPPTLDITCHMCGRMFTVPTGNT